MVVLVWVLAMGQIELLREDNPLTKARRLTNCEDECSRLHVPLVGHCDHRDADLILDHPCQLSTFSGEERSAQATGKSLCVLKKTLPASLAKQVLQQKKKKKKKIPILVGCRQGYKTPTNEEP